MESFLFFVVPLCVGWILDKWLGDPKWLPHPVVLFGRQIAFGEKHLNRDIRHLKRRKKRLSPDKMQQNSDKKRFWNGVALSVALIVGAFLFTAFTLCILRSQFILTGAAKMISASQMISANFSSILPLTSFFSPSAAGENTELTGLAAYHATLLHRGMDTSQYWTAVVIASILVFYCLAGKTLIREVREVFRACDRSLEEGRKQVARIVGRDTSTLSAQEVRTAALETLAENLNDGVIAPLFWYMLLGVPGMVAYKMVNTLDSMIGYRNERYRSFGRAAARIDDFANYIPARLTATLMVLVSGKWSLFIFVAKHGRKHLSPNSGYPEAALAGILNCRFGGPHDYFGKTVDKPYIGTNDRPLTTNDMKRSIRNAQYTEVLTIALCVVILYAMFF